MAGIRAGGMVLTAITRAIRTPDLRKKLVFTLFIIAVFRLGSQLPAPGVITGAVHRCGDVATSGANGIIYGLVNLFSGGALLKLSAFALGIMPYITASIILQLLTVVIPTLEKLSKEGELGRRKITQWTRYLTIALAIAQSFGIAISLESRSAGLVIDPGFGFTVLTNLSLTTGSAFNMWLGEQITERGIGNGMS